MYEVEKSDAPLFEFKVGKKTYSVPCRESLPFTKYRELQKRISESDEPENEAVMAIVDLIEEFAPGSLDGLNFQQVVGIVAAYSKGANLGESSTSSD